MRIRSWHPDSHNKLYLCVYDWPKSGKLYLLGLKKSKQHLYCKKRWIEKFGEWKHVYCTSNLNKGGKLTWQISVNSPGIYHLEIKARGKDRIVLKAETDEGYAIQNQQNTSEIFCNRPIGWISIDKSGNHTITVKQLEGENVDIS